MKKAIEADLIARALLVARRQSGQSRLVPHEWTEPTLLKCDELDAVLDELQRRGVRIADASRFRRYAAIGRAAGVAWGATTPSSASRSVTRLVKMPGP